VLRDIFDVERIITEVAVQLLVFFDLFHDVGLRVLLVWLILLPLILHVHESWKR